MVFLFPTDTFASRSEFTPQMKALCSVWASEASIHHLTRTQVQRKCLPLSGAQKCHAVPLLVLFPGDLIEKVKFLLGQTICSCRGGVSAGQSTASGHAAVEANSNPYLSLARHAKSAASHVMQHTQRHMHAHTHISFPPNSVA